MRWKISTESKTEDVNNERRKITKVTKTQYITIGDIVGMGKSAAGAVQKLAKDLPAFAKGLKEAASSTASGAISSGRAAANEAAAWAINAVVQPLAVILNGMEKFRKVMKIVDMLTPIAKTIARTTGVWCSPGNVMDMLDIAKGIITQVLIGILSSSILKLKEMIWNYEFDIREISEETSILICNLLKEFDKANENNKLNPNILDKKNPNTPEESEESAIDDEKFIAIDKEIDKLISQSYPVEETTSSVDVDDILRLINGKEVTEEDKAKVYDGYKTEYISDKKFKRKLYGSLTDGGIYYSDDNGETWVKSGQETGSFACFAKVLVNKKWRYLAGSTYYVQGVTKTADTQESDYLFEGCYKKDYYNKDCIKLTKKEKSDLLKETGFEYLYDKTNFKDASGIYYSDDNGETWQQTKIKTGSYELFFEFQEKVGHPARVVASSYDYKGVLYTEDGMEFNISKFSDETSIDNGRWVFYTDCDKELYNEIGINTFFNKTIINKPFINTIVNIELGTYNINTNMKTNLVIGDGLDSYNKKLIRQILDYIHENYTDNLPKYSTQEGYKFWRRLIDEINEGKYTLEDAKNGKGLRS